MEIKLKLEDIDYGDLAVKLLPLISDKLKENDNMAAKLLCGIAKMPPAIIRTTVNSLPQETKDEVAVLLINNNEEKIRKLFIQFAQNNGIALDITDIEAKCL